MLRTSNPRDATIELLSRRLGLREIRQLDEPTSSRITHEMVWQVKEGLELHYLEDAASKASCIVAAGDDGDEVAQWANMAATYIGAWTEKELTASLKESSDPVTRTQLLLLVGLGSPDTFDDEYFSLILRDFDHEDPMVRTGAVWATSYSSWREFVPDLRKLAASDPQDDVRATAHAVADIIERKS
ncbi:HEAT repeat domain-containing protein [Streptomyces antioxidans]|nr:HEAT repeat domain-containing protein [Streptomyces antioxidans]